MIKIFSTLSFLLCIAVLAQSTSCLTLQDSDSTLVNISEDAHHETKFVYNGAKYKVNT